MPTLLITFGWTWFVLGIGSGALLGLGFHKPEFWGGYDAWRRRLARLGHIAFFGTGMLTLMMGLTMLVLSDHFAHADGLVPGSPSAWVGWVTGLTLIGSVTMPAVCFLAAWRKPMRHLFVIPVLGLAGGVLGFTAQLTLMWLKGGVS